MRKASVVTWLRLARVFQKIDHASAEHLRAWGLSVAQFDVLAHVGTTEGLTQQELADSLLVTKGNICQLLDRLEHSGLIERRQERRTKRLFLTQAGQKLFDDVVPAQERMIASLFSTLAPEEERALLAALRRLDHTLQ
ncbi:MAG TPA: MarR family transcriptional regulator [Ktedonobacterales bacterium]